MKTEPFAWWNWVMVVRVVFIVVASVAYLGLAVLGWGGLGAFLSHPPLVALTVVLFILAGVSLFAGGNLSPGQREDRSNRWVLLPLGLIGLLNGYLPAYADRMEFWIIDGDTVRWLGVFVFAVGGALRLWPVFVLGDRSVDLSRSSPDTHLSPVAFMVSSATPAIWGYWSIRWVGASRFVPGLACCLQRCLYRRSSRVSARKRRSCARSLATTTFPTVLALRGWSPGSIRAVLSLIRL
jgi:hypothetical protein